MDNANTSEFFSTMTMAELDELEEETGVTFEEIETVSSKRLILAMARLAANRLGHDVTSEKLRYLTFDQLTELISRATTVQAAPPKDATDLAALLDELAN